MLPALQGFELEVCTGEEFLLRSSEVCPFPSLSASDSVRWTGPHLEVDEVQILQCPQATGLELVVDIVGAPLDYCEL